MWQKFGFVAVLASMLIGGLIVFLGDVEETVDFTSVFEVWSDVVRDVDQVGLKVTRISDAEETAIGQQLNASFSWGHGVPDWQAYVESIGQIMADSTTRDGIRYEFHVVRSNRINAFAIPGGHIYITTGMLDFLESEAELASVLGHEIAHVDLRHCIERLQYVLALEKIGFPEIGQGAVSILHGLATVGYTKYHELEADAQGVRMAVQAGYNPCAVEQVFQRMQSRFGTEPGRPPRTPVDAMAGAMIESLGNYPNTHPATQARLQRIRQLLSRTVPSGQHFYDGRRNYQLRISRSEQEFPEEFVSVSTNTHSPNR